MNKNTSVIIFALVFFFSSCEQKSVSEPADSNAFENMDTSKVSPTFFPVHTFILGEMELLKQKNKKIYRVEKQNGVSDSVSIGFKEWEKEMKVLFSPVIDSVSLSSFFVENKFMDQSIGSITLTYEPSENKPDSISWKNWFVYINPENQEVSRIYMVKKNGKHTVDQITWIPGKFCKVITVNEDPNCKLNKTKEQMFTWGE